VSVLVNKPAPGFTADAVMPDGSFKSLSLSEFKGKPVILFFYPLDFTFVCPTEIIAFSERMAQFKELGVQILGCSVDSKFSHLAWRERSRKDGGIGDIQYPILADITKKIASDYDVLLDGSVALRGLFLIDKNGVVQHQVVNNLPLGRSVDEALRMVKALQFVETHGGEVCPADWNDGKAAMKADPKKSKEYFGKQYA